MTQHWLTRSAGREKNIKICKTINLQWRAFCSRRSFIDVR